MLHCRRAANLSPVLRRNLPRARIRLRYGRLQRQFGTAAVVPEHQSLSHHLRQSIRGITPSFQIPADNIDIIHSPLAFYHALLKKIQHAERRIFLATLYVGKSEYELVETLRSSLVRCPDLRVSILTDALRGTREAPLPSCASLLIPLVEQFGPDRVDLRMYHTPNLTGLRKAVVPKRINEGWGLQHMKLYGVDDEIILSGANLSSDYFSDRQDRYHVLRSGSLTEYYWSIHNAVSKLSFRVESDPKETFKLVWPVSNPGPSPLDNPGAFGRVGADILAPLIQPAAASVPAADSKLDTIVYPVAQFSQLSQGKDASTELPAVSQLLLKLSDSHNRQLSWIFTAGYFNIHPKLASLLLRTTSCKGTIITASPWANGFYGSKGISGLLPGAYTLLVRRFMRKVVAAGEDVQIRLLEWRKGTVGQPNGWTYHAKGIWIGERDKGPCATVIGSSNYTKRSYQLDLEVGAIIITDDPGLKRRLNAEVQHLEQDTKVTKLADLEGGERRVGIRVRVAMWLVRVLGGAL